MNFSTIRLIASDVDGTLVNSQNKLSEEFYSLFQQLKAQGVLFVAASGRQYFNLVKTFEEIKDDVIFVAENGGYVRFKDEDILVQPMNPDITKELLIKGTRLADVNLVLCGKEQAYIENNSPGFLEQVNKYYEKYQLVDSLLNVNDDLFLKVAVCDFGGAENNSLKHFEQYKDRLQVTVSGEIWLDVCDQLTSKGRALEVLQKKYNISPEETMAFGDFQNDIGMMEKAYYSFAVENAHPDLKNAARFVTKSNNDGGVEEILQLVVDSKS